MILGWRFLVTRRATQLELDTVVELGKIVEPRTNSEGLRKVGVRVDWVAKTDPRLVERGLGSIVRNAPALGTATDEDASEWFRIYEELHPFVDGNGRTGSLLYNALRGSLAAPIHPPNHWDDPRRRYVGYPTPTL